MPKRVHFGDFWKPEACGQTVLPDRSILIGQKLAGNAKIEKLKCNILGDFQTMWKVLIFCFNFYRISLIVIYGLEDFIWVMDCWNVQLLLFCMFAQLTRNAAAQKKKEKPSKVLGSMVPFRWEKPHYNSNANIWASSSVSSIFFGKKYRKEKFDSFGANFKKNECISGFFGQGISNFFDKLQLDTNWNAKKNEESWMLQTPTQS